MKISICGIALSVGLWNYVWCLWMYVGVYIERECEQLWLYLYIVCGKKLVHMSMCLNKYQLCSIDTQNFFLIFFKCLSCIEHFWHSLHHPSCSFLVSLPFLHTFFFLCVSKLRVLTFSVYSHPTCFLFCSYAPHPSSTDSLYANTSHIYSDSGLSFLSVTTDHRHFST